MNEALWTVHDVAERLTVSEHTVYRLASQKGGIRSFKVGRVLRFRPEDVEEYLRRQEVKPPEKAPPFIRGHFRYVPGMKVV